MKINKKFILRLLFLIFTVLLCSISPKVNAAIVNDDVENEVMLTNTGGASSTTVYVDSVGICNFTDVKYIDNANYFKANPFHAINDGSDNAAGTCTTIAMQMLMGYHNYYTDRRLIPVLGGNGLRYLNADYANELDNPKINSSTASGYGRTSIGTEVGFYEELMDFNSMSGTCGIGQAIGVVANGARLFVNEYASSIKNNVSITSGFFDNSTAKTDIDSGKPIILACQPLFTGSDDFHVVVAYGYATYNGVDGFIVHCGWRHPDVHVWYPASWFGFQIRMSINHTHSIIDTQVNADPTHRIIRCSTCGFTGVDDIFKVSSNGTSIISVNYSLTGETTIPEIINETSIESIGNSAFSNNTDIRILTMPNTITNIDSGAFENCTNLNIVTLSNALYDIGAGAFKGCTSLSSVTIPRSVQYIDDSAFQNCTNLSSVILQREISNITNLGENVFDGCKSNLQITVPMNRIAEYKNKTDWSSYKNIIISDDENYDEINLHCLSDFSVVTILNAGYNKIYRLNVECGKSYRISSPSTVKMNVYNSSMSFLITGEGMVSQYLSPGIYYIDLCFISNDASGNISTHYELTWSSNGWAISYGNNNVLTHLHGVGDNQYLNQLFYINSRGAGFYEFKLTGTKTDGTAITCPAGAIKLYDDSTKTTPMEKMSLSGYDNPAQTKLDDNRFIAYLPRNGYFYLDVNASSIDLSSLCLEISSLSTQEIDLFDLSESASESALVSNDTTKGDSLGIIKLNQSGEFTVYASYTGNRTNVALFVLARIDYNGSTHEYILTTVIAESLSRDNDMLTVTIPLTDGTYYSGYFNKDDASIFSVSFNRLVTQYGSAPLVTDPDRLTPSGSQINIMEMNQTDKSYRETFITKDFTRLIYPDSTAPSLSRLDYHWYSSDDYKAKVTNYGTVLGKGAGTVKIMAVFKTDPSIAFVKEFTIINDSGTSPIIVNSTYAVHYSETTDGTFHLDLETVNCPYPWFHNYNWSLFIPCQDNSPLVTFDCWGDFTITELGCFTLTGSYLANNRVTVVINVIVE